MCIDWVLDGIIDMWIFLIFSEEDCVLIVWIIKVEVSVVF